MHYGFNNKKYPFYINGKQLVESDLKGDIDMIEQVQQRDTKLIPAIRNLMKIGLES
jgi:hypothetical protein